MGSASGWGITEKILQDERNAASPAPTYDRETMVEVLTYHWPTASSGCHCGWEKLGASFPGHVADVYEEVVIARLSDG